MFKKAKFFLKNLFRKDNKNVDKMPELITIAWFENFQQFDLIYNKNFNDTIYSPNVIDTIIETYTRPSGMIEVQCKVDTSKYNHGPVDNSIINLLKINDFVINDAKNNNYVIHRDDLPTIFILNGFGLYIFSDSQFHLIEKSFNLNTANILNYF